MADKTSITKSYTDPINDTGNTMISIDTSEGEGPYHFYLYDTDASGHGTYTTPSNYFTLDPDSANGTAKVNLINKLPAGDYYFKVKVVDESTNERLYYEPSDFTKDPYRTKETGVIHVQITKVSPTIAFDNPSQTKKSVQDATMATNWNETATANPFNSDLQIKYTIVSGDIGLIDLDENTGAVIYKGNGAFGKVKIRATVDEINPNSDNYNSAYVEKEIVVYREVDGVVTPHANSSDANVPTFQANDANVKTGGTIGTIKGTLGTPDTIGGTTTTYSYAIKSGGNGSFFTVNANSGEIKTNANLAVGTYTFTVTVSDKWSSKDIPVTVNVGMAPAEALNFYENSTSNTIINQKTV
ncbi:MAG: cadherin repeat domain-containing protein, partial [Erysipelotrichaceae bacterium]|nr:cadherin repeat domain-containing protein [Erysipelotrichaceae bacterium]